MKSIFIVTLLTLTVVLFLTSRYLLKDLLRLFGRYSVNLFSNNNTTYYSELGVTMLIVVLLAMGAAAVQSAAAAIFSLATTKDIAEFCISYRGVFSYYTSDIQSPNHHILWLFMSPIFKLLSVVFLVGSVRLYFSLFNQKYGKSIYSESDCFYFSMIGVAIVFGIEVFMHIQSIKGLNMTLNCMYVVLQNLAYFVFYFAYYWVMSMSTQSLTKGLEKYLALSNVEKKVLSSPWKMAVISYGVSVVLTLPCFLGLQWQYNNSVQIILFVIVGVAVFFLIKWVFARGWNYLSTILFDSTFEHKLGRIHGPKLYKRRRVALLFLGGCIILMFSVAFPKQMFLFLFLTACIVLLMFVSVFVVYGVALLVGVIVTMFKGKNQANNYGNSYIHYIKNTTISFITSFGLEGGFIFFAFLLITVFPKSLDCSSIYSNNSCYVDPSGEVLWVDDNHEHYFVPITYNEIPAPFIKMLLIQEDRCFKQQKSIFPNKSNWHGFSPAIFKRGGSNINCQIVKQMTYMNALGYPRDGSRKISDMLGSYQMSLKYNLEQLLEIYSNISSFNGARGYQGLNAASLYTFGRPIEKTNPLEMLYLISTLPRSTFLTNGKDMVFYTRVHEKPELSKRIILAKAKAWKEEGLISNREYRQLCNDSLRFSNHRYNSGIPNGTRVMLEQQCHGVGRHDCTITLGNEKAIESAYKLLKTKNVFQKSDSKLQVAALVVEARTGNIIGHFSSSEVLDYANDYTYPIGSLGKPAIVLELLKHGSSSDFRLFDGKVGNRKTPHNSHGWSKNFVGMETILSKSLNAPFANIRDLDLDPKVVFQSLENDYESMGIVKDVLSANDVYNYPLGLREMSVSDIAKVYQTIFNKGFYIPLSLEQNNDIRNSKSIWDEYHVCQVKNALHATIDSKDGTLNAYKDDLPNDKFFYGKTGTSSKQKDGWTVLSDGNIVITCWASYGKQNGETMSLGQQPLWGASTAGMFAVLIYNELSKKQDY